MSWRNAPSVAAALKQATERWPKRKKGGDGTIGDANHQGRKSDHNPDARGVVHAFDLTHDPTGGVDCQVLADHLVRKKDPRVRKIIFNHRTVESHDWQWRDYTGASPHTHHMHVSIHETAEAENDTSPWWDVEATNGGIYSLFADPLTKLAQITQEAVAKFAANAAQAQAKTPPVKQPTPAEAKQALKATAAMASSAGGVATAIISSATSWFGGGSRVDPHTGPPIPIGKRREPPPGWKTVRKVTVAITTRTNELLASTHPIGTHIYETVEGKDILFAVEWHIHAPTDKVPDALKKWHRGISALEQR